MGVCSCLLSVLLVSSLMYLLSDEDVNDDLHTIFKGRGHHFVPRAPHLTIGECVSGCML